MPLERSNPHPFHQLALLPFLLGAHGNAEDSGELRLAEAARVAGADHWKDLHAGLLRCLARLHLFHAA